ncbi:MAG: hypothetical protein LBG58_15585 [Planctomycetaceae bacterium]|jgi:hypothetical protein|nr:hypothetical protein [Planctomycetaceae bacterium]
MAMLAEAIETKNGRRIVTKSEFFIDAAIHHILLVQKYEKSRGGALPLYLELTEYLKQ